MNHLDNWLSIILDSFKILCLHTVVVVVVDSVVGAAVVVVVVVVVDSVVAASCAATDATRATKTRAKSFAILIFSCGCF